MDSWVICGAQVRAVHGMAFGLTHEGLHSQRGMERWPSGLRRTPGKRVGGNPSRVRIPVSPQQLFIIQLQFVMKNLFALLAIAGLVMFAAPQAAMAQEDAATEMVVDTMSAETDSAAVDSAAAPVAVEEPVAAEPVDCLLYTSPSPRDQRGSRMPSSA